MADDQQSNTKKDNEKRDLMKELRTATRDVHSLSDAFITLKVVTGFTTDDEVWTDGLLIFYEIFRFLENNCGPEMLPIKLHRTDAFEADLKFFLGDNWKEDYGVPRPAVQSYLDHLQHLRETNPILLFPYCWHLYMGLLSGGQILQKKRRVTQHLRQFLRIQQATYDAGYAVTNFDGDCTPTDLKKMYRKLATEYTNAIIDDAELCDAMVKESIQVFLNNIKIVKSVKDNTFRYRMLKYFLYTIGIFIFVYFVQYHVYPRLNF